MICPTGLFKQYFKLPHILLRTDHQLSTHWSKPTFLLMIKSTLFLSFLITAALQVYSQAPQIENFSMGGFASEAFTTNAFKCIGVGKGGRIWAGTQFGGLYTYDEGFNIWRKSDKLTNVSINDIKADPDSGIWIAQSGQQSQGGNSSIAGGVNYFPLNSDLSMNFYSVQGTTTSADLLSRNVRGLYIDPAYRAAAGRLPRVWAAQSTYITSFNTRRGGLSIGLNPFMPYFSTNNGGYATGVNAVPISEAAGGDSREVWVSVRQNNGGSQILRYKPDGSYIGLHNNSDVPLLPNGFIAQAIHFDAAGNRWIGMRAGGLVIKTPTGWVNMNQSSFFPPGTQVNYNAITSDVYGNVFIGTTNGLLEYKSPDFNPESKPDTVIAYKLYTTADGLPNNNITGLCYDAKNRRLLITSDSGVSFFKKFEPYIRGVVYDVFTAVSDTLQPQLQKKPLRTGVTVRLLRNNIEEEFTIPDVNGIFELKEANETDEYSIEIQYVRGGKTMKYLYSGIRNHTLLEPSFFPETLIQEINDYKDKLIKRCFPVTLYFQSEFSPPLLCTDNFQSTPAFLTGSYESAYGWFYTNTIGAEEHRKRVDNLANYYASLVTVYELGGLATGLTAEAVEKLFDVVESIRGLVEFGIEMRKPGNKASLEQVGEEIDAGLLGMLKAFKDGILFALNKSAGLIKDPKSKKIFERSITSITEVADVAFEAIENGRGQGALKVVLDQLKKILAVGVAIDYYRQDYAQDRHINFVPTASLSAYANQSDFQYPEAYSRLYAPEANSLFKNGSDTFKMRKDNITLLADIAKLADIASTATDAATALALVPGGQIAGAVAKALSYAAKGTKVLAFAAAVYNGAEGAGEVAETSSRILPVAGLNRPARNEYPPVYSDQVQVSQPDSLIARKTRLNNRLSEIQGLLLAPVFDTVAYRNSRKQYRRDDSLFNAALQYTLHDLAAVTDTAIRYVPGFSSRLDRVLDSFVNLQYNLRVTYYLQQIALGFEPNKSVHAPSIDSVSKDLKLVNDSMVNGLVALINMVNSAAISAQPYIVQESFRSIHSKAPGSSGSVTYQFRNHGDVTLPATSIVLRKPGTGYQITSADSVFVGNFAADELKTFTIQFQSPAHDSLAHYKIEVKSGNKVYWTSQGDLYNIDPAKIYSVRNGNWNNAATWNTNTVPVNGSKVYISHTVNVTADVTCRSVEVAAPGKVEVEAGKRVLIIP